MTTTRKPRIKYANDEERTEARRKRDAERKAFVKQAIDEHAALVRRNLEQNPLDVDREEQRQKALFKLRFTVLPALEYAISATPTGPMRNLLTEANILLIRVAEENPMKESA